MPRLTLVLVIGCAAFGCTPGVAVTATAIPNAVHSGETSTVTAQATRKQGMVAAAPGPIAFTASLGTVLPATVNTDNAGNATSTFTAPVVDRETPVTITATYGSASGTAVVTVNPAIIACQFPHPVTSQPSDPTDIVSIAPVVRRQANGQWQWVYTLTEGTGHAGGRTT